MIQVGTVFEEFYGPHGLRLGRGVVMVVRDVGLTVVVTENGSDLQYLVRGDFYLIQNKSLLVQGKQKGM